MPGGDGKGPTRGPRRGGRGRMDGGGPAGPTECICPKCTYKVAHTRGQPCNSMVCPKCGMKLTRG